MSRFTTIFGIAVLAWCFSRPAAADFIYDITTPNNGTHVQFTEPTILSSATTVSAFLLATTTTGQSVIDVGLAPVAGQTCVTQFITGNGPCITISWSILGGNLFGSSYMMPAFTSTGTFHATGTNELTLTISQASAIAEPSPLALLGIALGALGLIQVRSGPPRQRTIRRS